MSLLRNSNLLVYKIDSSITPEEENKRLDIIKYALENKKVIPYYQGLFNNKTNKIDKYEALMRIIGPDGTVYSPEYFMPISKKYKLYLDLNLCIFNAVLNDFSLMDCPVSVNLSPYLLLSKSFCKTVFSQIQSFYKPNNLILEILEDESAIDIDELAPFITEARKLGVKIAIDDFGAGYSNLLSVIKLQPDFVKIDGKIIKDVHTCFVNEVVVETVAQMGQKLSIPLVAEYVENDDIQKVVERYGIMYSQGYHFSKPKPFQDVKQKTGINK
ncbi:EAL domain-containing protein [Chakrabartyella piscis]|uniref:EAL domain-containing protein n=1 Tax=Chakrabartyella piscis TaxID=2918914 RepID=UPI0029588BCE|nr:EAL domain-containing protein [Chakrabartyella piscis]